MTSECPGCGRPPGDAYTCKDCAASARDNLLDLARSCTGLAQKADMQRAVAFDTAAPSAERPLPYDPRVSAVAHGVHNNLVGIARLVWTENRDANPDTLNAGSSSAAIAVWLTQFVGWMRYQPWCHEEWRSIETSLARIASVTDPPPEKVYVGDCRHCLARIIHTRPTPALVTCDECGEANDRDELTEALLARIDGHLGTIGEIIGLLRSSGQPVVSERTIQRLIEGKGLKPAATLTITRKDGRATAAAGWRVRDIRGLIEQSRARRGAA